MRAVRALVSGRVQGVGYRYSTHAYAGKLGLAGWVRNLPDGRVEVLAQGDDGPVAQLVSYLREGPRHAYVSDLEVHEREVDSALRGFHIAM